MATGLNVAQIQDTARGMGINLSTGDADAILGQAFDPSIFGADPGRVQQLLAGRQSTPSPTPSTGQPGGFQSIVQQALDMQRQAAQPAIQSLQASIPEVQQSFSQQRESVAAKAQPLQERYQNLLDEVTRRGEQSVNRQQQITSSELGKRGITGSSTLAQQEIQGATEPIREGIRTTTRDIGLAQEEGLAGLADLEAGLTRDEVAQTRAIQNAIAQLKSGGAPEAIQAALAQMQLSQSAEQQRKQEEITRQQLAMSERAFEEIDLPSSKAQITNLLSQAANRGSDTNILESIRTIPGLAQIFGLPGLDTVSEKPAEIPANVWRLMQEGRFAEAAELARNP